MPKRRYYSTRRHPERAPITLPILKELILAIYEDFARKGYFQEMFGFNCVDGPVVGKAGPDIEAFCLRRVRKKGLWPIEDNLQSYAEEDLLDVIELLHDCISKPTKGRFHSYSECGWHYDEFEGEPGRAEFREQVNELLEDYGERFELSTGGEIVVLGEKGLENLLKAEFPKPHIDPKNVEGRVEDAVRKFRRYNSSIEDRRDAVRSLADVLEFLRPRLNKVLTVKDEADLFNLANNFAIRHHNDKQRSRYDAQVWLSWMFYFYLATIHATIRRLKVAAV
jgi:hypothetical protein